MAKQRKTGAAGTARKGGATKNSALRRKTGRKASASKSSALPSTAAARKAGSKAGTTSSKAARKAGSLPSKVRKGHGVTAPRGFRAAGVAAGIKAQAGALDVALVASDCPAVVAGTFTQNLVRAAPVEWSEQIVRARKPARAVLINAGNANACTGAAGKKVVRDSAAAAAIALGCKSRDVLLGSTGVIGVPLPVKRLIAALPEAAAALRADKRGAEAAARAIMTTDLVSKQASAQVRVGHVAYTIGAMAKGSGMIHPNMATMLAVVTCDAPLSAAQAQRMLSAAVQPTFNSISVDGDTSTNDSVFFLANGAAGGKPLAAGSTGEKRLGQALQEVLMTLAEAIVADGEGAKKVFAVTVKGARSESDARAIARTIVTSPLVKTAVAGGDPNWGRVVAAAGRAGVPLHPQTLRLTIGGHVVAERGGAVPAGEKAAARHLREKRIEMELRVGTGPGKATALGCDLTYGYVDINAHYRT